VRRLLVTASVFPSLPILVTLIKEELSSSEMSVLTRATRRNIQKVYDCFLLPLPFDLEDEAISFPKRQAVCVPHDDTTHRKTFLLMNRL
jgi:hypothetical protein